MRSSNPILSNPAWARTHADTEPMTVEGTSNKTLLMLVLLFASSVYSWNTVMPQLKWASQASLPGMFWLGSIGALILAFVTFFKPTIGKFTVPGYAVLQGLFIGAISAYFEFSFPGLVFQAVLGTFGTAGAMFMLYRSGTIKATPKFRRGVIAATGGVMIVYLLTWILSFFGIQVPFIHQGGPLGIAFSLIVIGIAALNLILDFDNIEKGAQARAPKYMEWLCTLGLLVTLVWLYMEMLRLLAMLRGRE